MLLKCGGGTVVKNPPANAGDAGDLGSIPGLGSHSSASKGNGLESYSQILSRAGEPVLTVCLLKPEGSNCFLKWSQGSFVS